MPHAPETGFRRDEIRTSALQTDCMVTAPRPQFPTASTSFQISKLLLFKGCASIQSMESQVAPG